MYTLLCFPHMGKTLSWILIVWILICVPEHINNIKERTLYSITMQWKLLIWNWRTSFEHINPRCWMELSDSWMQQPQRRGGNFCVHSWEKANRNAHWLWQCETCLSNCSVGLSKTAGRPNRNEGRCQNLPDTRLFVWPACENLHSLYDPVNIVWVTE